MEALHQLAGQQHLGFLRVAAGLALGPQRVDLAHRPERQQREIAPHHGVGNRHHLGEHRVGRLGDAHVVALGLGHLLDAIQPFQQRHRQHALRLLAVLALQLAPHQQVELLVGTSQLQIRLQHDRVVALQERVQHLVHRDGHPGLQPLGEIVTLQDARHRVARGQLHHVAQPDLVAPGRVVADLGPLRVQHKACLPEVGLSVLLDLLASERRPRRIAPRGVTDRGREVPDQEDHLVPQVLELAHLVQHHRVAQVQIRRRGIQPQLDAQRPVLLQAAPELGSQLRLDEQLVDSTLDDGQRLLDGLFDRITG